MAVSESNRPPRVKLQVWCGPKFAEEVRAFAKAECASVAEIVRKSVSLFLYLRRILQGGKKLYIGDGENFVEVHIPL